VKGKAVAGERHEISVDFGLSGLTKWFSGPWGPETTPLGMVAEVADWGGGAYAPTLLDDALRLLESPLSTGTIDILWCAALGRRYDPDHRWIDGREWLRQIADVCVERIRQDDPAFAPAPRGPAPYSGLRDAVLTEIREVRPALEAATAHHPSQSVPEAVPALERAVTEVDPDLGFRLFLRAMKAYLVPISETRYERYLSLGEQFGYHEFVVDDGTLQSVPDAD
jgi:hypothetical protein